MPTAAQFEGWSGRPERLLRDMVAGGQSGAQIGRALGVSRNAVQGKVKRLGLQWHPTPINDDAGPTTASESRDLASRIVKGEATLSADMASWPEDRWLELIADIQAASAPARRSAPPLADREPSSRAGGGVFRPGQAEFRIAVLTNHRNQCCVTGVTELAVIEAAHIIPHALGGSFSLSNGLALRSDLHRMFDAGLLTVEPDRLCVRLSRRVKCQTYRAINGAPLSRTVRAQPDRDALRWHERNTFSH